MKCSRCKGLAEVSLRSHHTGFCRECFLRYFSGQVMRAIEHRKLIAPDDRVLVAVSGGKDSLGLALELKMQGYDVHALHIDLGIPASSVPARKKVEEFCSLHSLDLTVLEMAREGLAIPLVKARVRRPICSACGQIKRYYFNKVAMEQGYNVLATGHNLDDEVSRLFANTLRWDTAHLSDQGPDLEAEGRFARKVKPLYRVTEYETACYCFIQGIEPWSVPCPYSQGASFTVYKELWAQLEAQMRGSKLRFYDGFLDSGRPAFAALPKPETNVMRECSSCGYPTIGVSPEGKSECGVCRLKRLVREGSEE